VFEAPEDELETVCRRVRQIMENIVELSVPLKVNVAVGRDWAAAH
jgi:DNA polymerase-1